MNTENRVRLLAAANEIAGRLMYSITLEKNRYIVRDGRIIFSTDDIFILCNYLMNEEKGIRNPDLLELGRMRDVERLLRHLDRREIVPPTGNNSNKSGKDEGTCQ